LLFKRLIVVFACLILVSGFSQAAEISQIQKQVLVQKIEAINQGLEAGDIRLLVDAMPPRFYQEVAKILQRDVKELQEEFTSSLQQQFDNDGMKTYRFDASTISYHETKVGGGYALVPTRVEMQGTRYDFYTLALYDGGWYLLQGGQKTVQNPAFLEIYPFLGEITIPPTQSTKILK